MKSLSLSTPKMIFLVGIPGAGKTQFGTKFSDTFGAPFINTGAIRELITDQPSFSTDEQYIVDMLSLAQLTELLKTKKTILFEGNTGARANRTHLVKLAKDQGYDALFVWIQTDPATARQRATRPARGRNSAHLLNDEQFERAVAKFTELNKAENPLVISGRHTYASQARSVLKRLAGEARPAPTPEPIETTHVVIPERRRSGSIKIL